jgi:AcrR family transcriptional regulator
MGREERGAATRERLLQATVDCLYEKGYVATTTVEVCKRAKAPRGTLLHHFGTKTELVVAAAEHIFELRLAEFRRAIGALPPTERHARTVIDLLWSIISGPTFYAWLELTVAARTDPELRAALVSFQRRFEPRTTQAYYELFPHKAAADPTERATKDFGFALLNGLAIDRIFKDDSEITPVLALLKDLSAALDPPT